jgi:signal peptidase I
MEEPINQESKEEGASKAPSFLSRTLAFLGELLHVAIISLAIIVPVRVFLIQPFYVKGASMEPNFFDHEYLIINEIGYRMGDPARGDIVVFRYPNDPRQFFIKRIVALPGERVTISGGEITIHNSETPEGFKLDESGYLSPTITQGEKDVLLGAGEYYLLGDNRSASLDSRIFGPVPESHLIGKVWIRGWPPERVKVYDSQTDLIGDQPQAAVWQE